MDPDRIARRSVAFFFLTSVPNVLGVVVLGVGLAAGVFAGSVGLVLALLPALIAAASIGVTIALGRWAGAAEQRLRARSRRRLAAVLRAVSGGVEEALSLLRGSDPLLLIGLIGYLAFDVMLLWASFHAFGSSPALAIIWMGYLIGELGGLIPIPGGVGGIELGLVGTLVLYGISVGAATAAVLGYRAIALVVPALLARRRVRDAATLAGARGARHLCVRARRQGRRDRPRRGAPDELTRRRAGARGCRARTCAPLAWPASARAARTRRSRSPSSAAIRT